MGATTPLRSATITTTSSGTTSEGTYPARLLALLDAARDLASWSDELVLAAADWRDRYHLGPARAHVLRTLDLPTSAVVLEIGAGAGAATRHLGETFSLVDGLEPDADMVAVASARCADLPQVTVRHGWIDDVPAAPTYDLIVALDVIGEMDRRGDDLPSFVTRCRSLLTPQGVLVLGVDNLDGVRFAAGDVTPALTPGARRPRRVSRAETEQAVRAAGLQPTVLSAFPDHRSVRTLFEHTTLAAVETGLLAVLPHFPSTSYDGPPLDPSAEARLWAQAIDDGRAHDVANSHVVLASLDGVPVTAAATYWSDGRRAALSATNTITVHPGGGAVVDRALTFPDAPPADGPLALRPHTEPLLPGTPLTSVLAGSDDLSAARDLLVAWAHLVDQTVVDGEPLPWDLIPRNVLVQPDGALVAFDQEWQLAPAPHGADLIRRRGAFWLAYDLLTDGRPGWLPGRTFGDAADILLRLADPTAPPDWQHTFVDEESTHMSHVWPTDHRHSQPARARRERNNVSALSNMVPPENDGGGDSTAASATSTDIIESLVAANAELRAENESLRLEQRRVALSHRDHAVGLVAELEALRERLARAQRESRRNKDRALRLETRLKTLKASTSWRIGNRIVRPFAVLGRKTRR